MQIAKATLMRKMTTLRCVRFDKTESPKWINDGKGWQYSDILLALHEFELKGGCDEVSNHSEYTVFRVQPPTLKRVTIQSLMSGVELWVDK